MAEHAPTKSEDRDKLPGSLDLFNASPNPYVLLSPELRIADVNDAYLSVTGSTREQILGRYLFDAFPSTPTPAGIEAVRVVRESMLRAFKSKKPDVLAMVRFDLAVTRPDGTIGYEERYWSATHTPILDEQGDARFVLQHTVDITELHRLRQQGGTEQIADDAAAMVGGDILRRAEQVQAANVHLEADIQRLTELFNQAPSFMAVLRGPEHVFELANEAYLELVGGRELRGKTAREALPEVEGQGFFELLDQVYATGEAVVQRAAAIEFIDSTDDQPRRAYLDFLYQPIHDAEGDVIGILAQGHDVTDQFTARAEQASLIGELEAAKERLARALSTGRVGVFEWNVDSDVLSISGPIAQYFGVEQESAEEGLPLVKFMAGIHEDDQERVAAAVRRTAETGEPYQTEYRLRGVAGMVRSVIARGHIETVQDGAARFIGVLIDITEQKEAETAVRDAEQRLRLALEASRMGDWEWDAKSDRVELSPRAAEIFGVPSQVTTWSYLQRLIHPEDRPAAIAKVEQAAQEGSSYTIEYRVWHGSSLSESWVSSRGRAGYDAEGRLTGMFGIVEDVTVRKKAEEAEKYLLREIDHRAKNIMAVVQSLVKLTPFRNRADYVETLSGRIDALARAHSLLAGNRWLGASLGDLIRQELAPYSGDESRFSLDGPAVEIRAQGTQALGLILHELATNAAKHGALSHPQGCVTVEWGTSEDGLLEITWRETSGKPVGKPTRTGFGTRLLDGAAQQLGAEVEQEWLVGGLRFMLRVPRNMIVPALPGEPVRRENQRHHSDFDRPLSVLVVEDEALIAMAIESALRSAGARVVGPVHSLHEALAAARETSFDVALVDMALRGESALPLVEQLRERRKPFVIVTGYETPDIDHDRVLRKPISNEGLIAAVQEAASAAPAAPDGSDAEI